jgi:hypothetical protein
VWSSTPALLALTMLVTVLSFVLGGVRAPDQIVQTTFVGALALFAVTALVALARFLHGTLQLVRLVRHRNADEVDTTVLNAIGNLVIAAFGALVAFFATVGFSRGRQLRRLGKVLLPTLHSTPAWATSELPPFGTQGPPPGLAEQWRANGKTEHASVAAFARVTLDLMALGAPPQLLAAANRDALDEIRHTELCFSLASALDGKPIGPAPFPEAQRVATLPRSRPLALAKLAVDSLVDGALHEGVSARIIAKLAQRCEVPAIRTVLKEIAADEGRHAAHGWAVVEWCRSEGGSSVDHALLGAIQVLPTEMKSELPAEAADGAWERWGVHGRRLEEQEYLVARRQLIERVLVLAASRAA